MAIPKPRWCQTRHEVHDPHVWKGPGYKYLCMGLMKGLDRANMTGHAAALAGTPTRPGIFLFAGSGDIPRRPFEARIEVDPANARYVRVIRASDGHEFDYLSTRTKFWAAPLPTEGNATLDTVAGPVRVTVLADDGGPTVLVQVESGVEGYAVGEQLHWTRDRIALDRR
jgi:hypothetical protein